MESKISLRQNTLNIYHICILWTLITVGCVLCTSEDNEAIQPELMPSITEVVHFENESYIIACKASGTRLRWFDPSSEWVDPENRDLVHVEENENQSLLIFKQISIEHRGNWTCEAEKGHKKVAFEMIVHKPITFVDTPSIVSVKENEEALIKCMATGDPEPKVSWDYNGVYLKTNYTNNEGRFKQIADGLLIEKVRKSDSGEYTCKAFQLSSALSNVNEQTIRLNVQHKPYVHRESADVKYGYINGVVNVTCEAEAEPPATFKWYFKKKHLSKDKHIIHDAEHMSILQLNLESAKQFGIYTCEANNKLGTLTRTIELKKGNKPDPPPFINQRGGNTNTFDLDVGAKKTSETEPMNIIGYRFEIISNEILRNDSRGWANAKVVLKEFTDGVTYLINDLQPNTTYWVRVASESRAGLSDWMGPKNFSTLPKAPSSTASHNIAMNVLHLLPIYLIYGISNWIARN